MSTNYEAFNLVCHYCAMFSVGAVLAGAAAAIFPKTRRTRVAGCVLVCVGTIVIGTVLAIALAEHITPVGYDHANPPIPQSTGARHD